MDVGARDPENLRVEGGSLASNILATLRLGLPLVGAQLAQQAIHVTDTIMVGRLGTVELAAGVITAQLFYLVFIFGTGFAIAVMPVAASAKGRSDDIAFRRTIRMGLWVVAAYTAVVMPILWFTEPILVALGQSAEVARLSGIYMRILQWAMLPSLAVVVFRSFLSVLERPGIVFAITLVGVAFNALVAYAFIYGNLGAPDLGIAGAGVAGLATMVLMATLLAVYSMCGTLAHYRIFVRIWKPDWANFREIARLGWPIGLTIIAEAGLFAASAIMIGWFGAVALAAHGIAVQLAAITFMIPLGLASAATVRVGLAYGRHDAAGVGMAARAAFVVGLLIAGFAALMFWLVPEMLIGLYLDRSDPDAAAVLAASVPMLMVAAAFQLFDSGQALASGVLRGLKDTRVPMLMAIVAYWLVGMPVGYVLAFTFGLGPVGIWWGLAFGLLTAASMLTGRFLRRERRGEILHGA